MAFFDFNLTELLKSYSFGGYFRRSSEDNEDKQMRSIEGQQQDIEELIIKLGLTSVRLFQPESQSAFKVGRPIFNSIIEAIENEEINAFLCWHANRISRNYGDGGKFVQLMSEDKLKVVLTPHGIFENTGRDREYLMNEFTRATRDSDDKSDAVKRGNRTKLKVGFIPSGRLPEGFIHTKNERSEMVNDKDPDRFPLLQKAVRLVLDQTHTPVEALNVLNNEWGYRTRLTKRTGGNPLAKSTWYRVLSGTKYYGELHRKEGVFSSQLPKLIEKEDFDRLQIIVGGKSSKRRTRKSWPYTGLGILCGDCNGTVIMDEKWQIICPICKNKFHKAKRREECPECKTLIKDMPQPKILHYTYLVGNHKKLADGTKCKQSAIAVKSFEEQIDALLAKFTIPESFKNWAVKWLQNEHTKEVSDRTTAKERLQALDTSIQKQLDTLLGIFFKKLITEEEYEKKKNLLLLEQEQIRRNLQETDKRADNWLELTEKTFNFACYARFWFAKGTNQQKREILATIGSNLLLKDKKLLLRQRKPFTIINGMQEKIEILLDVFEPNELLNTTAYSKEQNTMSLNLLRD